MDKNKSTILQTSIGLESLGVSEALLEEAMRAANQVLTRAGTKAAVTSLEVGGAPEGGLAAAYRCLRYEVVCYEMPEYDPLSKRTRMRRVCVRECAEPVYDA